MANALPDFEGIILAGGSSKRFGGADKALIEFDGRSFLERALDALSDAHRTVVVGPAREGFSPSEWVAEKHTDGGPVAALAAGLEKTGSEIAVVLAVDMPLVTRAEVHRLVDHLVTVQSEAVALSDSSGCVSHLAGAYRREPLMRSLSALPEVDHARLRDVVKDLDVRALESKTARDCDSPDELLQLEAELRA